MKKIIYILMPTVVLMGCASSDYDKFAYSTTDSVPIIKTPTNFDRPLGDDGTSYEDNTNTNFITVPNALFYSDNTLQKLDEKNATKIINYNAKFLNSHQYAVIKLISYSNPSSKTKQQKSSDLDLQKNRLNSVKKEFINKGVKIDQIELIKNQITSGNYQRIDIVYKDNDQDNIINGYQYIGSESPPSLTKIEKVMTVQENESE